MQGKPVGVLEVDSQIEREFFGHHVAFIEALAGVVSLSLERLPDPGWVL
jgi:putative methionine-R-sulfoxide reductase with GAF domain